MDSRAKARGLGGVILGIGLIFFLGGCARVAQSLYLRNSDADAKKATKAIEAAKDNAQQAKGYSDRGDSYADKARYSRTFKLISSEDYDRLFQQAIKDHDQAIALDAENPEMYFHRGLAFYHRAALDLRDGAKSKGFYVPAMADFSTATVKNPKYAMAWDMRGLIDVDTGDLDQAVADFGQEAALNPRSQYRLADAYCQRGSVRAREMKYDAAVTDFEKAIEIETASDPCECEPFNPLLGIYLDKRVDYAKARAVAERAQKAGKTITPENLAKLKKASHPG